jgi:hypothetical protein
MLGMFQFQVRFSSILFIVLYPTRDEADPLGSTLNHNFKDFGKPYHSFYDLRVTKSLGH